MTKTKSPHPRPVPTLDERVAFPLAQQAGVVCRWLVPSTLSWTLRSRAVWLTIHNRRWRLWGKS